jgi:hypothetical protein
MFLPQMFLLFQQSLCYFGYGKGIKLNTVKRKRKKKTLRCFGINLPGLVKK